MWDGLTVGGLEGSGGKKQDFENTHGGVVQKAGSFGPALRCFPISLHVCRLNLGEDKHSPKFSLCGGGI